MGEYRGYALYESMLNSLNVSRKGDWFYFRFSHGTNRWVLEILNYQISEGSRIWGATIQPVTKNTNRKLELSNV